MAPDTAAALHDLCDGLDRCPNPEACSVCHEGGGITVPEETAETGTTVPETARQLTLVVEIPVTVLDPEWDDQTLIENAADYITYMVHKAEKARAANALEDEAYKLSTDITVWTLDGYTADLNDLAG